MSRCTCFIFLFLFAACSSESSHPAAVPVSTASDSGWVPLTVAEQQDLLIALKGPTPLTLEKAQLVAARLQKATPSQAEDIVQLLHQVQDDSGPSRHIWANGIAALIRFESQEALEGLAVPGNRKRLFIEVLGLKGRSAHLPLLEPFRNGSDLTLKALASHAINLITEREGGRS